MEFKAALADPDMHYAVTHAVHDVSDPKLRVQQSEAIITRGAKVCISHWSFSLYTPKQVRLAKEAKVSVAAKAYDPYEYDDEEDKGGDLDHTEYNEALQIQEHVSKGEKWLKRKKGAMLFATFRHNQLNLLLKTPSRKGSKRKLVNVTAGNGHGGLPFHRNTLMAMHKELAPRVEAFLGYKENPALEGGSPEARLQLLAYPLLSSLLESEQLPQLRSLVIPPGLSMPLRNPDPRVGTKLLFGTVTKPHVRRFVELVRRGDLGTMWGIQVLRRLVPHEWLDRVDLRNLLALSDSTSVPMEQKQLTKFLSRFSADRAMKLMTLESMHSLGAFRNGVMTAHTVWRGLADTFETIRLLEAAGALNIPDKPKNWREIHDHVSRLHRRLRNPLQELDTKKLAADTAALVNKLDGYVQEDLGGSWKFETPKSNHQLAEWGETMNNCISGYWGSVVSGSRVLFAVYHEGRMLINGEIQVGGVRWEAAKVEEQDAPKFKVIQCVGQHNRSLTSEERVRMSAVLKDAGVRYPTKDKPYACVGWQTVEVGAADLY